MEKIMAKSEDLAVIPFKNQIVFLGLNFFQLAAPYFFALYSSHEVHNADKQEEERPKETEDGHPFTAIEFIHRAA